jgi:hypothetical protein
LLVILKSRGLVRPIAKGLAGGVAATAKGDCGATAKAVGPAFHIDKLDFAFDAEWTVIANCDFRRGHLYSYARVNCRKISPNISESC